MSLQDADCIRLVPVPHRGLGEIVPLQKKKESDPTSYTFNYQRDTYVMKSVSHRVHAFAVSFEQQTRVVKLSFTEGPQRKSSVDTHFALRKE